MTQDGTIGSIRDAFKGGSSGLEHNEGTVVTTEVSPRLRSMWRDNPADPGRLTADDPRVRRLIGEIAPGSALTDLGGTFSLNLLLEEPRLVLRVHQAFISRNRLLALQRLRETLAVRDVRVAGATAWRGHAALRCGDRWAELEPFIDAAKLGPSPEAYRWLFASLGELHRHLATIDLPIPRPLVATYATPSTLTRWLAMAAPCLPDGDALDEARRLLALLRHAWVSTTRLPRQLIHGDARLGNVRRLPGGEPLFLDFGFAARRPRVHELAYSLVYMVMGLAGHDDPRSFDWSLVGQMIGAFEEASGMPMTPVERAALPAAVAAVPLYHVVTAGFVVEPLPAFAAAARALPLSRWLLAHPECVGPSR